MASAIAGNIVGAFVGDECRGTATVQDNGRASFVVMEIEMAQSNEVVSFKVYDNGSDEVYPADYSTTTNPGETIGDPENLIPINAITDTSAPNNVGRMIENGYIVLYWEPIDIAITYRVYSSDNPYSGFTLDSTGELNLTEPAELDLGKHLGRYCEAIEAAAGDYRPLHREVRGLQRGIRLLERERVTCRLASSYLSCQQ